MEEFIVEIIDRMGHIEHIHHKAKDSVDARIGIKPCNGTLCRNSYVILENASFYTHQIIDIIPV